MPCSVNRYLVKIPIGSLEIFSCSKGLHSVHFKSFTGNDRASTAAVKIIEQKSPSVDEPVKQCCDYLLNYFAGNVKEISTLPSLCWTSICAKDTFTDRVLRALATVQAGRRVSYKQLAELSERPGAYRAVGTVMRRNPVCLFLPCHRVIKSSGDGDDEASLGNYTGGVEIKKWLLQHEKAHFSHQ